MNDFLLLIPLIFLFAWSFVSLIYAVSFQKDWIRQTRQRPRFLNYAPKAAVILPVKGCSSALPKILQAYANLDYPDYELVIAVEAENDPVLQIASQLLNGRARRLRMLVAGKTELGSQKIANQLAAWQSLNGDVQLVCFADADAIPSKDWLQCLADWTLLKPQRILVSGYRWFTPLDYSLPTLMACLINNAVAFLPRHRGWNLAWGGAMASHQALLKHLDLEQVWQGVASDDLVLTQAVIEQGGYVEQIRDLLVLTPVSFGWRPLLEFVRRQYTMLWLYARPYWWWAAVLVAPLSLLWAYAIWLSCTANGLGAAVIVLIYGLELLKALKRRQFILAKWPGQILGDRSNLYSAIAVLAYPLVTIFHSACILSTFFRKRFVWAGIHYDARKPGQVIAKHQKSRP